MVHGNLKYWFKRAVKQGMGMGMGERTILNDLADISSTDALDVHWEEKTGEKKGFIFKREELKELKVQGYRCTACNYLELYAEEG
jgi:hypothetical protein